MTHRQVRLGLRARAVVGFAVVGLALSILLAGSTMVVSTGYLVEQRQNAALRQAFANARLARSALRTAGPEGTKLVTGLGGTETSVIVRVGDEWFSGSLGVGRNLVPDKVLAVVDAGHAGHQRVIAADGRLQIVVGVAIPAGNAAYFEVFPLTELERTVTTLRSSLLGGAALTVVASALIGRYAAGRVVRPLGPIAAAAQHIADGSLDTRLPTNRDPDLDPLTNAFNTMAGSLEARVARDARFTSDVSHELRSPLAVLSASIEIIERRRAQLPGPVSDAVDQLRSRITQFQALVLELLEISLFDNQAVSLDREPIEIRVFLRHLLQSRDSDAELIVDRSVPNRVSADRRRLAQALGNVIDNAGRYAGGLTAIHVTATSDAIVIDLDDNGPGVDPDERRAIFERFARGTAGRRAGDATGTGLGLALVSEQVKLHGGTIEVTDAPRGGARFRVQLPRHEG